MRGIQSLAFTDNVYRSCQASLCGFEIHANDLKMENGCYPADVNSPTGPNSCQATAARTATVVANSTGTPILNPW
jgi:hypothetical protein